MAIPVRRIACVNNAAFVMSFGLEILDLDLGRPIVLEGVVSPDYPIDEERTIDLINDAKLPVTGPSGLPTLVRPQVYAVLGTTNSGNPWIQVADNSETATYDVRGTTLNFSVNLI
jgi:hypothetical protein